MPILKDFIFHSPVKLSDALGLFEKTENPLFLAGGTFVINHLKKSSKYPSDVISLKKIGDLKGIKIDGADIWIGSMTTIKDLIDSELIRELFPSLSDASARLGTTPIRNMATIGGNIASRFYWVDLPSVLISLGARVILATNNKKDIVPLEEFLSVKPGKKGGLLIAILLPRQENVSLYFRHTKTAQEVDVPMLGVAFSGAISSKGLSSARFIVNTSFSIPTALKNTEGIFNEAGPARITIGMIDEAVSKDVRDTKLDEYRIQLIKADIEKALFFLNKK